LRKPTRSTLKNKLDKICGEIVRGRGRCQRCGKTENLQTAHIFGRTYLNTRWDIDNNLLCLCPDCHINFAHKCPLLFTEFVKKLFGEERYELLKESHNQIYKPTIYDLEIKLKILQDLADKKEG
jgi:5-methylcytosine-specific restriction endonuclease McrA